MLKEQKIEFLIQVNLKFIYFCFKWREHGYRTIHLISFQLVPIVIFFFYFLFSIYFCFSIRLESPTRSLIMEAPRGVQVSAAAGDFKATCRKELHLQSTEGEVSPSEDTEPLLLREFLPLSSSANPGQARCALCQSFLQESTKLLEYESEKSRVPLSDSTFSTEKKNMDYLNPYIFQN